MPCGWLGLAGLLVLAAIPRESGAQLTQASTGFAFARVLENAASVVATPGPNGLDVTIGATATDALELPDDQYLLDFAYAATMLGSGNVTWGQAAGSVAVETTAEPELSPPVSPTGQPMYNLQSAEARGQIYTTFTELGTLTSNALPAGTPVQVVLNARVDSLAIATGSLDPPNETRAGSAFEARLTDIAGTVELFLSANEIKTATLNSAVGRSIEVQGIFRATAEAFAGGALCCPGYTPEATALVGGFGALWLTLPAGVGFDAASDHDYTVPVPEPGSFPLALTAALAMARLRESVSGRCAERRAG